MEYFRFVPPTIIASLVVVNAMPSPQNTPSLFSVPQTNPNQGSQNSQAGAGPGASPQNTANSRFLPPGPQNTPPSNNPTTNSRFLPQGFLGGIPQTNPNQHLQNTGAGLGLGAIAGIAGTNCIFGGNCDLSFRPSIGGALDANGQFVPQLGVTTQVGDGNGGIGTTFTGGVQLDQNSDNGFGGFVAGGLNNGDADGFSPGVQTGFGISQQNGQNVATAQLGGNLQGPGLAGVNFNRPGNAGGIQPTVLGQAAPQLNLFNLFRPGNNNNGGFNFGR